MGREIPMIDKKVIAAFDFDGTIIKHDSLPVFIRFVATLPRFVAGSLQMLPHLTLFALKLIPNYQAKEKLFKTFFTGFDLEKFNGIADNFSKKIDQMVNPAALEKIKWHHQMGHHILIISASAENWIRPWAVQNGIHEILATRLEVKNGQLTGKFLTRNCHGQEKVDRLLEVYPDREKYTLYAYGDTNGDKELLALADHSFYRTF